MSTQNMALNMRRIPTMLLMYLQRQRRLLPHTKPKVRTLTCDRGMIIQKQIVQW